MTIDAALAVDEVAAAIDAMAVICTAAIDTATAIDATAAAAVDTTAAVFAAAEAAAGETAIDTITVKQRLLHGEELMLLILVALSPLTILLLMQLMQLMYNLTPESKNALRVGLGYQYWKKKFGNESGKDGSGGSTANTPMIHMDYHF